MHCNQIIQKHSMSFCCAPTASTAKFFSYFANGYCRRFKKKGFEASQKQLLEAIEVAGFDDRTLMEIGCGVGHLHLTLLERGARSALGIELSPKMLALAKQWSNERAITDRVEYIEGDFMTLVDQLNPADIVILDKVICCYPDVEGLVGQSVGKTLQAYVFTIPRSRWLVRFGMSFLKFCLWLIRSEFRPYIHDLETINTIIESAGFKKFYHRTSFAWDTCAYAKVVPKS